MACDAATWQLMLMSLPRQGLEAPQSMLGAGHLLHESKLEQDGARSTS